MLNDSPQCTVCVVRASDSTELKLTENRGDPPMRLLTLAEAEVTLSCHVSGGNKGGHDVYGTIECYSDAQVVPL